MDGSIVLDGFCNFNTDDWGRNKIITSYINKEIKKIVLEHEEKNGPCNLEERKTGFIGFTLSRESVGESPLKNNTIFEAVTSLCGSTVNPDTGIKEPIFEKTETDKHFHRNALAIEVDMNTPTYDIAVLLKKEVDRRIEESKKFWLGNIEPNSMMTNVMFGNDLVRNVYILTIKLKW